ncbi:MAG: hypothetical protein ACI8W8_001701 [Rhodothermales bacterium]|jgi:hypothetical protein
MAAIGLPFKLSRRIALAISLAMLLPCWADTPTALAVDDASGLKMAEGWETVRANCVACHSGRHFLRQTGSRDNWKDAIRWMQRTQGLWPLAPEVESVILDFLSTNYAPSTKDYRRAPLSRSLLPPNPYGTPIPVTKPAASKSD